MADINVIAGRGPQSTIIVNRGPLNGGTPGGPGNSVQYNVNGVFNGSNTFTFNPATSTLAVQNLAVSGATIVTGSNIGNLGVGQVITDLIPDIDVTRNLGSTDKRWKDLYLSGNTIYLGEATITTTDTGAINFPGNVETGGNISSPANVDFLLSADTKTWTFDTTGNLTLPDNTSVIRYPNGMQYGTYAQYANIANVANVANSVSGSNVVGAVATANTANVALTVSGSNVSGQVALAIEVTQSNQPNITTVGTLTTITVGGVSNLGAVGNVKISGGQSGSILTTDGAANLSWASSDAGTF